MKVKIFLVLMFLLLLFIFTACSKMKEKTPDLSTFSSTTKIIPKQDLYFIDNKSISLVVSFNDSNEKFVHTIAICFYNTGNESYMLSDWFKTKTHPSSLEFPQEINRRWKEDFLLPDITLIEALYYPEPAGRYKIEAIYHPQPKQ